MRRTAADDHCGELDAEHGLEDPGETTKGCIVKGGIVNPGFSHPGVKMHTASDFPSARIRYTPICYTSLCYFLEIQVVRMPEQTKKRSNLSQASS